jgi:hypothetical protein
VERLGSFRKAAWEARRPGYSGANRCRQVKEPLARARASGRQTDGIRALSSMGPRPPKLFSIDRTGKETVRKLIDNGSILRYVALCYRISLSGFTFE